MLDTTRAVNAPYFTPHDQYWGKAATDVGADVVVLGGDFDSNSPILGARARKTSPNPYSQHIMI